VNERRSERAKAHVEHSRSRNNGAHVATRHCRSSVSAGSDRASSIPPASRCTRISRFYDATRRDRLARLLFERRMLDRVAFGVAGRRIHVAARSQRNKITHGTRVSNLHGKEGKRTTKDCLDADRDLMRARFSHDKMERERERERTRLFPAPRHARCSFVAMHR